MKLTIGYLYEKHYFHTSHHTKKIPDRKPKRREWSLDDNIGYCLLSSSRISSKEGLPKTLTCKGKEWMSHCVVVNSFCSSKDDETSEAIPWCVEGIFNLSTWQKIAVSRIKKS